MRRFWAHLILAITTIFVCVVSYSNVFTKSKSNIEYSSGYEVVYNITEKDSGTVHDNLTPAQNIANAFEKRLKNVGLSSYEVMTVGEDSVKVTFSDADDYQQIVALLPFNGVLALTLSITGPVAYQSDFLNGKAYIDEINNTYPTVVIPVKTSNPEYKTLIDALQEQDTGGIEEETGETDDEGNAKTETKYYTFLWYDFDEDVDNYELSKQDTPEGKHCKNKIMMSFERSNLYFDSDEDKLAAVIGITDSEDNTTSDTVATAYKRAKFYVNLINSGELDYAVKYAYSSEVASVNPTVESLVYYGDPHAYVSFSATLIATIISAIVIILFLIMFYKVGALSICASTILSVFSAVGVIVAIGAEVTTAGIVGIILVALASLASGISYLTKLKNECYKGRTLKKANEEAYKKSVLLSVDVNVVIIIIGAFCYLLGGSIMRTFSVATVIGGLISLVANTLGLKGLMWLATNSTKIQDKYSWFGVDEKKVPDFTKEEKQSYFGPFEGKNPTKYKKSFSIIGGILFLASVAGMIAFGVTNKGEIYNYGTSTRNSEIVLKTTEETSLLNNSTTIDKILSSTKVYESGKSPDTGVALSTYKGSINSYVLSQYEKNEVGEYSEVTYYYNIVKLNSPVKSNLEALYTVAGSATVYQGTINDVLEDIISDPTIVGDLKGVGTIKEVYVTSSPVPNYIPVMVGTIVGLAVLTVYYILRYRLSRGLSTILLPTITSGIAVGIFVLTRVITTAFVSLAIPFIAAFTFMLTTFILNKERELIDEDRSKQYILKDRQLLSHKAITQSLEPLGILAIIAVYMGICFFGFGPKATSTLYVAATFGFIIAAGLVIVVFIPMSNVLFRKLKKIDWFKINAKPKKKKKVQQVKNSSEPEEAIFFGIND